VTIPTRLILSLFLLVSLFFIITNSTNTSVYNIANAAKYHSHYLTHNTTNTDKLPITTTTNTPAAPSDNVNTSPTPPVVHNTRARAASGGPTLNDPDLKLVRILDTGLKSTTSMAFLGPDDLLVLEKDTGIVHRILNGKMLPEPLLDVNVANEAERGLLGIAIANNDGSSSDAENGDDNRVLVMYFYIILSQAEEKMGMILP
jgi:glucose/arabinose dehydrogenase